MAVTIKDIAKVANVSYSTVSKALNDSPLVKPVTKTRINKIAEELGYQPNFAAQRLVQKKSKTIGVIWPTLERIALSALISKINEYAKNQNYNIMLSIDEIEMSLQQFQRFQVDGVIVFDEQTMTEFTGNHLNIPVIAYGVATPEKNFSIVDVDYKGAISKAVDFFNERMYKKIAFVGYSDSRDDRQLSKLEGFIHSAERFQLDYSVYDTGGLDWINGYNCIQELLDKETILPDGIICSSYDITSGVIRGLHERNIHIPNDISIIGYDNIPQMSNLEVPITTVGVSNELIAKTLVDTLITQIDKGVSDKSLCFLHSTIVVRESTK